MSTDVLQPASSSAAPITVDVTDRAGRLLGHITVDGQPIQVTINGQPILATIQEPLTVDALDGTVFVRSAAASTFPVNVGRVGGTATDVNAGNAGAGTQRVVLATDQPTVPVSIAAALEVTTDPDAPPLVAVDDVAPSSELARWQGAVLELLLRQTAALEALAIAVA